MSWFRSRRARRRAKTGAAVGVAVATALIAQMSLVSNASWNDKEWVHAEAVGTSDCSAPEGSAATRGAGRALSGSLLGLNLDSIVEASGVTVTNNGQRDLHSPAGALPATSSPAWADPLNVTALSAINVNLGQGMLQLPLDNSTGVLGQFGSAATTGVSQGAAGYIDSSGGIATDTGSGYPDLATLKLSDLISSIDSDIAATLANVADLSLEVGAVTGRATLDGCDALWSGVSPVVRDTNGERVSGNLDREYLTSAADLVVNTPTLTGLTQTLDTTVEDLEDTVNGLTSNQGVLDSLLGAVNGLLGTLVSGVLGVGSPTITLTATVDTTALRNEIHRTTPLADSAGVVSIDLPNNEIRINTLGLLQQAYPGSYGSGLNALPPNTNILADEQVLNTLVGIVGTVLGDWLNVVNNLIDATIDAVQVNVVISAPLKVTVLGTGVADIGTVNATVSGPLTNLTTVATVNVDLTLLNWLDPLGLLGLKATVNALLSTLVTGLVAQLGPTVGNVLSTALSPLRSLSTAVTDAAALVVSTVSNLYSHLLVGGPSLAPILALTVNAQNDPFAGSPEPSDWTSPGGIPNGQYDVAALRISVLEGLTNGVVLYLGRGSVGRVCSQAELAAGGCAGY